MLKQIQNKVKIGIIDTSSSGFSKMRWLRIYNIQYYHSWNASCLHHVSKAKNLKVIELWYFPSCAKKDLNKFLQLKYLHTLIIEFRKDLK